MDIDAGEGETEPSFLAPSRSLNELLAELEGKEMRSNKVSSGQRESSSPRARRGLACGLGASTAETNSLSGDLAHTTEYFFWRVFGLSGGMSTLFLACVATKSFTKEINTLVTAERSRQHHQHHHHHHHPDVPDSQVAEKVCV